jgi:hypothetical protein
MYRSAEQATAAVRQLHEEGFTPDLVDLVTASSSPASASGADPVVAAIVGGYVLKRHAVVYAEAVRRGAAVVIVRAPFSYGGDAIEILDSCGPIDTGIVERVDDYAGWNEATPLSSILWMPLLTKGSSGFSSFWNLPVLTRAGRTLCSRLGIGELSASATSLSGGLGLPLLSRGAAPLSSALKIPLLA